MACLRWRSKARLGVERKRDARFAAWSNARDRRRWTVAARFPGLLVEEAPSLPGFRQPAARVPAEQPVAVAGDPAIGPIAAEARYHAQQRRRQRPPKLRS